MGEKSRNWGGARPGAGRPPNERLSASELRFLAGLLELADREGTHALLVAKIRRVAERAK